MIRQLNQEVPGEAREIAAHLLVQSPGRHAVELGKIGVPQHLLSITYPKGKVLTFGYDAAGRVTSLTVGSAIIATNITYFPFGAPSGWTWGNSLAVTRSFDLDGRLAGFPLTTTDSRNVTYDVASRITEIKHPTNPALVQTMGYDRLDRLTSWVNASSTRNYGYDANGNRTTLTIGANNYTYTTPATTNRLGSTSGPSPARTFAYDGAGNTTGNGQFTLTYNDRGRLVQAVKGSTGGVLARAAGQVGGNFAACRDDIWSIDWDVAIISGVGAGAGRGFATYLAQPRRSAFTYAVNQRMGPGNPVALQSFQATIRGGSSGIAQLGYKSAFYPAGYPPNQCVPQDPCGYQR